MKTIGEEPPKYLFAQLGKRTQKVYVSLRPQIKNQSKLITDLSLRGKSSSSLTTLDFLASEPPELPKKR